MSKTILITGATDGIGRKTARMLVSLGHTVLIHGRNPSKLEVVKEALSEASKSDSIESYVADLSQLSDVEALAKQVTSRHSSLDVLINNAGVFKTPKPVTEDGLDIRFVVNAIAPYLLTKRLLPLMSGSGRVVNVSSAAQSPVNVKALSGQVKISTDFNAYAQSKLALTMWSRSLALSLGNDGPAIIAVNPGSMLGSKMVKEAFGSSGKDIGIGAEILTRAATSPEFAAASGQYFDNDSGRFAPPHPDALNPKKNTVVVEAIENLLVPLNG